MIQVTRLPLLAVAAFIAGLILALPGRAQQAPAARYAFSDTTLLRDTLDLKFTGLFPLADSLNLLPDSLRALSIRYRTPLLRLVHLADSLRVPVDSVGPVMARERYNPLAASVRRANNFGYSSGFSVGRRSTSWSNDSDYNLVAGPLFLRNITSVSITRNLEGGLTARHKSRSSTTELGWRFSPNYSAGGRISLQGTENFKPGSIYNNSETTNQYEFSVRTRQAPTPHLSSEVNLRGGPFDEPSSIPIKRGFGGSLDGHLSFVRGPWLTQDLYLQTSGKFGRARLPERPWLSTQDISRDLRGDISLFGASPAQLRINFRLQKSTIERPDTVTTADAAVPTTLDFVKHQPSTSRSVEASLRLQRGYEQAITFTGRIAQTQSILAVTREGRFTQDESNSDEQTFSANGRFAVRGWGLDASFSNSFPISEQPRRSVVPIPRPGQPDSLVSIYYRDRQKVHTRTADARLSKNLSRRLTLKLSGNVSLSSYIESALGTTNHTTDNYRQEYRIDILYTPSLRFSTTLGLDVSRLLPINLLASASAANREDRSYLVDWRWTYRLLGGLTATQQNQLSAGYTFNSFAADRDRLALDYRTVTTLNALVTPRLNIDVTHNARVQPSGGYTRESDGLEYFSRSDENLEYTLSAGISYRPAQILNITIQPFYQSTSREGTVNGLAVPTNQYRSLSLSGGASLNLPVTSKGRLSGTISRSFSASRTIQYPGGVPQIGPLFQDDYWNGALQFSWTL